MPEPHAKRIKTMDCCNTMDCSKKEGEFVSLSDRLPWEDLLPQILSFVGDGHYRFVGPVNHAFHHAYVELFPYKETYVNVSSKALAELCMNDCAERHVAYYKESFEDDEDVYAELDGSNTVNILLCNAAYSNFEVLQHLHSLPIDVDFKKTAWGSDDIFTSAAESGHLPVVQWLHEVEPSDNSSTIYAAACAGNLEILQWCHAQDSNWDEWVWNAAAEGGHLPVLEFLYDNGYPFHKYTCAAAAEEGHLEALQWLRSKGCPWSPRTAGSAVYNGHLHVLKWAYHNGCPVDYDICICAFQRQQWEILQWAIESGLPVDREFFSWLYVDLDMDDDDEEIDMDDSGHVVFVGTMTNDDMNDSANESEMDASSHDGSCGCPCCQAIRSYEEHEAAVMEEPQVH